MRGRRTALRRPDEMADSTDSPSEHAAAGLGEQGGGTNGDGAGALCQYQHGGPARAPRLGLEIREPFLHLITSMRAALNPAADGGAGPEGEEAPAGKNQGQRRLTRVGLRALQIGDSKIARTAEFDIAAKFQYKKPKKIVLQLHQGDAFVKIDILWSNILAMSACFDDERFDTLRIQVKCASERYSATQPLAARMHLRWQRRDDVIPRTFLLWFDKGTLERGYGKMMYTAPSLLLLPSPPPGQGEEGEEEAPSPPFVGGATPSTMMMMTGSANTGAGSARYHEYWGTQLQDSIQSAHTRSLYR